MTEGDRGVHAATIRRILAPALVLVASAPTHACRARQLPTDEGHAVVGLGRPKPAYIRMSHRRSMPGTPPPPNTVPPPRPSMEGRNGAYRAPTMSWSLRLTRSFHIRAGACTPPSCDSLWKARTAHGGRAPVLRST